MKSTAFIGNWRIVEMDAWDIEDLGLLGTPYISFSKNKTGEFQFVALVGYSDCRYSERAGRPFVEFTWDGKAKTMSKKAQLRPDPIERDIEQCLDLDRYISDGACFSFVADLETVESKIQVLAKASPYRAVSAYEAFIAGCYEKALRFSSFSNRAWCH